MKLSKFTCLYHINDYTILFNTLSKSIIKLNGIFDKEQILNNAFQHNENKKRLQSNSFIVNNEVNENKLALKRLKQIAHNHNSINITLLVTNECNCDCFYCYEKGMYSDKSTFNDYNNLELLFEEHQRKHKSKTIELSFHGGEPTLYPDVFIKTYKIAQKHFTNVCSTVVTNGTLISRDIIEILNKINTKNILITIDGPREIHNKRRPYKNKKGSPFDDIVQSLQLLSNEQMPFHLSINIDKTNYKYLPDWFKIINKYPNSTFYIARLVSGEKNKMNTILTPSEFSEAKTNFYKNCLIKNFERDELLKKELIDHICSLKSGREIIVDSMGDIYKCISLVGNKKYSLGNISEDKKELLKKTDNYIFTILDKKCYNCKYFPLCYGGCLLERIASTSNYNGCRQEYYNQNLKNILSWYVRDLL